MWRPSTGPEETGSAQLVAGLRWSFSSSDQGWHSVIAIREGERKDSQAGPSRGLSHPSLRTVIWCANWSSPRRPLLDWIPEIVSVNVPYRA